MKWLILLLFLIVLYCLASASYYLVKKQDDNRRMAQALTWRISLCLLIFICLIVGFVTGLLQPHGFGATRSSQNHSHYVT